MILVIGLKLALAAAPLNNLDPSSPESRMMVALKLAENPVYEEEAHDALVNLLSMPEYRTRARTELVEILMEGSARVGWSTEYRALKSDRYVTPEFQSTLALRLGEAPPWSSKERKKAIAQLQALRNRFADPVHVDLALGHLYLLEGDAKTALGWYQDVVNPLGAEGEAYALMALGRQSEIIRMPSGEVEASFQAAIQNPTAANRARALFDGGYALLAKKLVGTPQNCRKDGCVALGEIYYALGDYYQEVLAFTAALKQTPSDPVVQEKLVGALLDNGELAAARSAAGENALLLGMVEGERLVAGMDSRAALADRDALTARAYGLASNRWKVRVARALVLAEAGSYGDAESLLNSIVMERSSDPVVLWAYTHVGIWAGKQDAVLAVWHTGLKRAISTTRRAELGRDLAIVYGIIGEYQKNKRGDLGAALLAYQTGIAMQPGRGELYQGMGGVLWKARRFKEARNAYLTAIPLETDPTRKADAYAFAALLSIELGDPDRAEGLMRIATGDSPYLQEARRQVAYARVIAQAHSLSTGDRDDAIRTLRWLSIEHAFNPPVLQAVGYAMLEQGFPQDALDTFKKAQRVESEIARYLGAPSSTEAWLKLGEILALIELGDLDGAGQAYQKLQLLDTSLVDPEAIETARISLLRGWGDQARKAGHYDQATEFYRQVRGLDAYDGWTYIGMGEVALATGRPEAAYAYFTAAASSSLKADSERVYQARLGQLRALQALNRLEEAEVLMEEAWVGGASGLEQEELLLQIRLARVDQLLKSHDRIEARRVLAQIRARYPESPEVRAAEARLELESGNPDTAYSLALRALRLKPTLSAAALTLVEAARQRDHLDTTVEELALAYELGGDPTVKKLLAEAQFELSLQQARASLKKGRWTHARTQANAIWEDVQTEPDPGLIPDRAAQLAGLYLDMGLGEEALAVFGRALEEDRNHLPSILGIAGVYRWQGRPESAVDWLEAEWKRTGNAEIGLALVELYGQLNQPKKAEVVLNGLDQPHPASSEPQKLIPLPDGSMPPEDKILTPVSQDQQLQARIDSEAEVLRLVPLPDAGIGLGIVHQSGTQGRTWLLGNVSVANLSRLRLGPVSLVGSALPLALTDGVVTEEGVALEGGAELYLGQFAVMGRAGVSPLGFRAGSYTLWSAQGWYTGRTFAFGLATAREPVTDSLASWAGRFDPEANVFYGRASWTWFGGWAELSSPSGLNGGLRLWAGSIDALSMQRVSREMITGWLHQTLKTPDRTIKFGLSGSWMQHDRQVDGFEAGQAGAFTPDGYTAVFGVVDARWRELGNVELCGGLAAGLEVITGTDTDFLSTGAHPALDLHGGLDYAFAENWHFGAGAAWMTAGGTWNQELAMLWLRYEGDPDSPTSFQVAEIHGQRPTRMTGCR